MTYTLTATTPLSHADALERIRALLAEHGFGVLGEIDFAATLAAKLGPEAAAGLGDYRVLLACNPPLARRALEAEPRLGVLLPCNVVVRRAPGDAATTVEAVDPQTMSALTGDPVVREVADDAGARLTAALAGLPAVP